MISLPALLALSTQSGTSTPSFGVGALVAWWICSSRKRQPIGGWLLYYYWQLYAGVLVTALFLGLNLQSYVPENFTDIRQYYWFLASVVPTLITYVAQIIVATFLLIVRSAEMVKLLKWTIAAELAAGFVGLIIDANYFAQNVAFNLQTIIPALIWLGYLHRSARVRYVFYTNDWDSAVQRIYPEGAVSAS